MKKAKLAGSKPKKKITKSFKKKREKPIINYHTLVTSDKDCLNNSAKNNCKVLNKNAPRDKPIKTESPQKITFTVINTLNNSKIDCQDAKPSISSAKNTSVSEKENSFGNIKFRNSRKKKLTDQKVKNTTTGTKTKRTREKNKISSTKRTKEKNVTTAKRKALKKDKLQDPRDNNDSNGLDVSNHSDDMPTLFYPSPKKQTRGKEKLNMKLKSELQVKKTKKKRRGVRRVNQYNLIKEINEQITKDDSSKKGNTATKRTGHKFSVTGNWYIASGYLNDIINLLEEFENMDGWRFKDFAQCWQNKSFSLVYRGRQTFKEMLEFAEEISILTMRFISPSHPTKRRIGALYTLYGLYYKFPMGFFFSLRFSLEEYKNLLELIDPFRCNIDNPDPAFIFRKLELKGTIYHTVSSLEPCYDFHNDGRDFVDLEYGKQKLAKSSAVTNSLPTNQLENDLQLLNHYHALKTILTGTDESEGQPEKALSMIKTDMPNEVRSELKDLRQKTLDELGITPCLETPQSDKRMLENEDSATELEKNGIDDSVLETNKSHHGQMAVATLQNNASLSDENVQKLMELPSQEILNRPLKLVNKLKKGKPNDALNFCLDLDDICYSKSLRVDLLASEADSELARQIEPQLPPSKRKRGRKRPGVILKASGITSIPLNKEKYNPCRTKTLKEEPSEDLIELISATKLKSPAKTKSKTLDAIISITSGLEIKDLEMKLIVTNKQANEIENSSIVSLQMKKKLEPMIKLKLQKEDAYKMWNIDGISLSQIVLKNQTTLQNKVAKPICFKNRFECLKQQDSGSDTNSSSSSDEDTKDVEKLDLRDIDYVPLLTEEADEIERKDQLDEDLMTDNSYSSHSDDDTFLYKAKKHHPGSKKINNYNERVIPPDSDRLLQAEVTASLKMIPIIVGGRTRYFPQATTEKAKKDKSLEENKENFGNYTWNDFSSSTCAPITKKLSGSHYRTSNYHYLDGKKLMHLKTTALIKKEPEHVPPEILPDIPPEWGIRRKEDRKRIRTKSGTSEHSSKSNSPERETDEERPPSVKKEPKFSLEDLAGEWNDEPVNVDYDDEESSSEDECDSIPNEVEASIDYSQLKTSVPDTILASPTRERNQFSNDNLFTYGTVVSPPKEEITSISSTHSGGTESISPACEINKYSMENFSTLTTGDQDSSNLQQFVTVNCEDNRRFLLPVSLLSQLKNSNIKVLTFDSLTPIEMTSTNESNHPDESLPSAVNELQSMDHSPDSHMQSRDIHETTSSRVIIRDSNFLPVGAEYPFRSMQGTLTLIAQSGNSETELINNSPQLPTSEEATMSKQASDASQVKFEFISPKYFSQSSDETVSPCPEPPKEHAALSNLRQPALTLTCNKNSNLSVKRNLNLEDKLNLRSQKISLSASSPKRANNESQRGSFNTSTPKRANNDSQRKRANNDSQRKRANNDSQIKRTNNDSQKGSLNTSTPNLPLYLNQSLKTSPKKSLSSLNPAVSLTGNSNKDTLKNISIQNSLFGDSFKSSLIASNPKMPLNVDNPKGQSSFSPGFVAHGRAGPSTSKCSFFFSPKMRSLTKSKNLVASGKPPEKIKNKPVVKFLMKGLFGRSKKL